MQWLVWGGAAITIAGFLAVVLSMILVARARAATQSDEDLRARIASILPINIGGLFLAFFGLMVVVVGVILA